MTKPLESPLRLAKVAATKLIWPAVLAATSPAFAGGPPAGGGGAIASIVTAATTLAATVTGICLLVMTAAWGIAGYRMAFQGVAFRDVSANLIGGAIAGSAAAIAAVFIT